PAHLLKEECRVSTAEGSLDRVAAACRTTGSPEPGPGPGPPPPPLPAAWAAQAAWVRVLRASAQVVATAATGATSPAGAVAAAVPARRSLCQRSRAPVSAVSPLWMSTRYMSCRYA